jgi:hypothetical protein
MIDMPAVIHETAMASSCALRPESSAETAAALQGIGRAMPRFIAAFFLGLEAICASLRADHSLQ